MIEKPYAPSCDKNQSVILSTLKEVIKDQPGKLLEVGSGTGQHAVFCAPHFPQLTWCTSDVTANHEGIQQWLEEIPIANIEKPVEFEVGTHSFPKGDFDYVFTANTLHIMSWEKCQTLIKSFGENLKEQAVVMIYGAFNYNGDFTSESNKRFNQWLKDRDSQSGIRRFEDVEALFQEQGFSLQQHIEMPANNRFLIFRKILSS